MADVIGHLADGMGRGTIAKENAKDKSQNEGDEARCGRKETGYNGNSCRDKRATKKVREHTAGGWQI